ncbi:hypothetical protein MMC11_002578 [Xylographa trunciseda]|nr:hypothetical protein [Xylographa trunciseda]
MAESSSLPSQHPQPDVPWHAAFPAPQTSSPATIPRAAVLQWFSDGKQSGRDFVLVDLRKEDHKGGTICGSLNLPAQSLYPALETLYALLSAAGVGTVVWYCGSCGGRGTRVAGWFEDLLRKRGDERMKSFALEEGIKGWVRGGDDGDQDHDKRVNPSERADLTDYVSIQILSVGIQFGTLLWHRRNRLLVAYVHAKEREVRMVDDQEADIVHGQREGRHLEREGERHSTSASAEHTATRTDSRPTSPTLPIVGIEAHSTEEPPRAQDVYAVPGTLDDGTVGTQALAEGPELLSPTTGVLLPVPQAVSTTVLQAEQNGNSAADPRVEGINQEVHTQYIGNGDTVDGEVQSTALLPYESSVADVAFLDSAASVTGTDCPTRIQAFAKLEFDDGQFYMNTYSVELGRDIRAARVAFQSGFGSDHEVVGRSHKRSNSSADAGQVGRALKQEEGRTMANSVVSETGGIIGLDMSDPENRRKTRRKKAKSTSSSSHNISRKGSMRFAAPQTDYQSLAMASLTDPRSIDALTFLPSPEECPLIPIHPPAVAEGSSTGHRGISRRHVRIAYNFERRLFELVVQGKNGAFVDEQYFEAGETQELKSGSYIQIGGVGIRFVLPDVAIGETGAEGTLGSDPVSGGAMSFDFEDGRGESLTMADSEISTTGDDDGSLQNDVREDRESNRLRRLNDEEDLGRDGDEDEQDESEASEDEVEIEVQEERAVRRPKISLKISKPKPEPKPEIISNPLAIPPRRKGPGRPPKNGIISKREQALIARQVREAAKAEALKNGTSKSGKGKSGKLGNDVTTTPPPSEVKTEKRKYTKRKKAEEQTEEPSQTREMTERTDSIPPEQALPAQPPKPAKEKRPPKPPRSPSPVFDEATLTAEQLAKPAQSYVILIHEALTNSKTGAMSLPQIYRAIERRYPYYKLRVQTTGWQSSVRHNLSQHPAFRKIERDGKGWMWGLVPEISIEKEKKRRPSPPLMPPQHYYQQGPHMYHPPYPYQGMPPPNGHLPPPMGHPPYAMHPGVPPPPHGYPPYPSSVPRGPTGVPLPLVPQTDTDSTYRSPYQPPPPSQPAAPSNPQPQTSQQQPPPSAQLPQPAVHDQTNSTETLTNAPKQTPPPPPPYYPTNHPAPSASPHQSAKAPTPIPAHHDNTIGQSILKSVGDFKSVLLASLSYKPNAEEIVQQAINRTLGIAVAAEEFPEEAPIMNALRTMIDGMRQKDRAQRQASTPAPLTAQEVPQQKATASDGQASPAGPLLSAPLSQPPVPDAAATLQPPPPPSPNTPSQAQLLEVLQQLETNRPLGTTQNQVKLVTANTDKAIPSEAHGSSSSASEKAAAADGVKADERADLLPNGVDVLASAKNLKRELEGDDDLNEPGMGTELPQAKRVAV